MFYISCECFVLGFLQWTSNATCSNCHDVPTVELQDQEHYSSLHQHGGRIYCSLGNLAVSIPQEKMTPLLWNPVTSTLREWCGLMNPSVVDNRICRVQDATRVVLHWSAQSCALPGQVTAATVTSSLQWLRHVQKTELSYFLSLNWKTMSGVTRRKVHIKQTLGKICKVYVNKVTPLGAHQK